MGSSHIAKMFRHDNCFLLSRLLCLKLFRWHSNHSPLRNTKAYDIKHVPNHDDTTTESLAAAPEHPDRLGISALTHVLDPVALHLFVSLERCCVIVSPTDSTPPTSITRIEIADRIVTNQYEA